MNTVYTILFLLISMFGLSQQSWDSTKVKSTMAFLASDELKGRVAGTINNDIAARYIATEMEASSLVPCVASDFYVPFNFKGESINNVCGAKPGNTDQIIVISAHFDHVSGPANASGDAIYNGADDNATGVTAVLGIAKLLENIQTDKTIWFIGFNAEESGLLGSKEMVTQLKEKGLLKNISAVLNFEMLGAKNNYGKNTVFMTGDERSNLDETLNDWAPEGFKIIPDPSKQYQLFYRSDNAPFAKEGIIAHSFSATNISNSSHYHQPNDDLSNIDIDHLTTLIESFAHLVEKMANSNLDLKYVAED